MVAIFGLLLDLHTLQEISEDMLKCLGEHLHLNLNSDLHKTNSYEEIELLIYLPMYLLINHFTNSIV